MDIKFLESKRLKRDTSSDPAARRDGCDSLNTVRPYSAFCYSLLHQLTLSVTLIRLSRVGMAVPNCVSGCSI